MIFFLYLVLPHLHVHSFPIIHNNCTTSITTDINHIIFLKRIWVQPSSHIQVSPSTTRAKQGRYHKWPTEFNICIYYKPLFNYHKMENMHFTKRQNRKQVQREMSLIKQNTQIFKPAFKDNSSQRNTSITKENKCSKIGRKTGLRFFFKIHGTIWKTLKSSKI